MPISRRVRNPAHVWAEVTLTPAPGPADLAASRLFLREHRSGSVLNRQRRFLIVADLNEYIRLATYEQRASVAVERESLLAKICRKWTALVGRSRSREQLDWIGAAALICDPTAAGNAAP